MDVNFKVILIFAAFGISTRSQRDSTDENRPYKFGFNIEGYQHRFEEKNEKGIIMGEYGFITGDGVYHLTVYATDENGNFKIVRTKNIYIGLPGEKMTTRVPALSSLRPERVQEITLKSSAPAQGVAGCGGCLIPTTASPVAELRDRVDPLRGSSQAVTPDRPATSKNDPADPKGRQIKPQRPQILFRSDADERGFSPETGRPEKSLLPPVDRTNDPKTLPHEVNGLTMNAFSSEDPKTDLISKIPKMTSDIQNTEDLQSLFYLFNYTLTYHGHNEFGNRAGDKNGSYFFNGRDGFGRNVTYVANEFGYQPNISLYDLTEGETPREQTEKNSTKLLGNEFKWFYDKKTPSSAKK